MQSLNRGFVRGSFYRLNPSPVFGLRRAQKAYRIAALKDSLLTRDVLLAPSDPAIVQERLREGKPNISFASSGEFDQALLPCLGFLQLSDTFR